MVQNIVAQLPIAAAPPPIAMSNPSLYLPLPLHYGGDSEACCGFLNQCTIDFEVIAHHFVSNRVKITFIISLLSDEALAWATPLLATSLL